MLINGYWWLFYWWILVNILLWILVVINYYYIEITFTKVKLVKCNEIISLLRSHSDLG